MYVCMCEFMYTRTSVAILAQGLADGRALGRNHFITCWSVCLIPCSVTASVPVWYTLFVEPDVSCTRCGGHSRNVGITQHDHHDCHKCCATAAYCTCEGGNPTVPGAAPRTGASETNIEPPTQICTAKNYYGQKKCRNLSTEEVDQWRANEQKRHAHERESAGMARDAEEVQANRERRDDMDKREADSDAVRAARDAEAEERRP